MIKLGSKLGFNKVRLSRDHKQWTKKHSSRREKVIKSWARNVFQDQTVSSLETYFGQFYNNIKVNGMMLTFCSSNVYKLRLYIIFLKKRKE